MEYNDRIVWASNKTTIKKGDIGHEKKWNYDEIEIYFYTETPPTGSGNYWHYGEGGEILI